MTNHKNSSIIRSVILVSFITILSKLLGFARETIIAAFYGATSETDVFFFAQEFPKMIFPTIGDSVALTFTTLYVAKLVKEDKETADRYGSGLINTMVLIALVMSVAGLIISPFIIPFFAPGFSEEQIDLAIVLSRISLSTFVMTVIQYMLGAVLNAKKLFGKVSLGGIVYNCTIIIITLILGKNQDVHMLMWTIVVGMAVQTVVVILFCVKKFRYYLMARPFTSDAKKMFRLAIPIIIGNSVTQINGIVDKALGSTLQEGSISALSYSNSLRSIVMSVCVFSLSTVIFPSLSEKVAKNSHKEMNDMLLNSMKCISIILLPIICVIFFASYDIVAIVFGRGNFDDIAISMTAIVLRCYVFGLLFSGLSEVLTRGYFALQNTKTPAINSAIGVVFNVVFSITFVRWLGIAGIAIGTTISTIISTFLLIFNMKKTFVGFKLKPILVFFIKLFVEGATTCAVLCLFTHYVVIESQLINAIVITLVGLLFYTAIVFVVDKETVMLLLNKMIKNQ